MKTRDAIRFFGSQESLRAALNLKCRQTIWAWEEFPPYSRQYQIEVLTNGVLRAERPLINQSAERPVTNQLAERPLIHQTAERPQIQQAAQSQHTKTSNDRRRNFADPANHDYYTGIERRYILQHPASFDRPGA